MINLSVSLLNSAARVGDRIFVGINVDTMGTEIVGVDVDVDMSSHLQIVSVDFMHLLPQNMAVVKTGTKVMFSQITKVDGGNMAAKGLLAVVQCQAISAGYANIKLNFTLGATTDCNIVSPAGKDLLAAVTNKRLTIT